MEEVHASPFSSECMTTVDFLSKLALESPVRRSKRRGSGGAMKLMRTNSISKMFPSSRNLHPKSLGSSWGEKSFGSIKGSHINTFDSNNHGNDDSYTFYKNNNDSYTFFKGNNESITDITLSSSISSFDDEEFAALNFIKDIDLAMIDFNKRIMKMKKKIDDVLQLAQARYECGNEVGCLLSMRKVHRNRRKVGLMDTTRLHLGELRKQVETYMKQGDFDFDIPILRNHARDIISRINTEIETSCPSDKDLLSEVYKMTGMVEI